MQIAVTAASPHRHDTAREVRLRFHCHLRRVPSKSALWVLTCECRAASEGQDAEAPLCPLTCRGEIASAPGQGDLAVHVSTGHHVGRSVCSLSTAASAQVSHRFDALTRPCLPTRESPPMALGNTLDDRRQQGFDESGLTGWLQQELTLYGIGLPRMGVARRRTCRWPDLSFCRYCQGRRMIQREMEEVRAPPDPSRVQQDGAGPAR